LSSATDVTSLTMRAPSDPQVTSDYRIRLRRGKVDHRENPMARHPGRVARSLDQAGSPQALCRQGNRPSKDEVS